MFSKDLELTIGQCYKEAREQRHEFMTVEHLLLALLENPSAAAVLRACNADIGKLGRDLRSIITETVPVLPPNDERDTQPTLGFQRVLQRAVYHVQSSGRKEVTGANVLVAIFGEKDSHAVYSSASRKCRGSMSSITSRTASPRSARTAASRSPVMPAARPRAPKSRAAIR